MPQTDAQASLSIGALKFDPTDATHNTLIAGIGDYSSLNSIGGPRTGFLRTTNGGTNWSPISFPNENISGVAERGATIVASVDFALPFDCAHIGIGRSINTGASFFQVGPQGVSHDLASDPSNNAVLYTDSVFADSCSSGFLSNGIYKSTDSGATWNLVSDATMNGLIVDNQTDNVKIAVGSHNDVDVAIDNLGEVVGLFHSPDGGVTWQSLDLPVTIDGCAAFGLHPGKQAIFISQSSLTPPTPI